MPAAVVRPTRSIRFRHRSARGYERAERLNRRTPEVCLADIGDHVRKRGNELEPSLTSEHRHLAHDTRVGDDGGDHSFVVTFALIRVRVAERERRKVAVEDPDGPARLGDAGDFGQHGSRPLHVADQRVRDDSIEFGSTHIETLRIADVEVDAAREILLARKPRRHADEKWAAIDTRDVTRKPRPAGYPSGRDTGATTKIDDRVGVIDAHRIEILIQHPHENRLPATHLKARDDGVENGILQLIGHTIGVDARRRRSLRCGRGQSTGYPMPL